MHHCLVCHGNTQHFYQDKKRSYFSCAECGFICSDPNTHLPQHVFQQRFKTDKIQQQHKHTQFIATIIAEFQKEQSQCLRILNYGQPLKIEFASKIAALGHQFFQFNPFVEVDTSALKQQYDVIINYRVVEHFTSPKRDWLLQSRLLKSGGWMIIETQLLHDLDSFCTWRFINDSTRVSFYQIQTLNYLADLCELSEVFNNGTLILLKKN
ncbi:MAG: class I SAM-dependent methyltransferase [Shewanella sp.]|nr:class I SAM-dependent methyltransferase [Shewanella sp.]